jgi:hypothetical protein
MTEAETRTIGRSFTTFNKYDLPICRPRLRGGTWRVEG